MTTPPSLENVLANDEFKTIREAAEKLQSRLDNTNESDGILTTSRSLVETTCKTLLDCLNVEYDEKADLPDISKKLTKALDLHPASKTNQALRQICQGAISMINGIASVRNAHSDAHGQGVNATDLPFRHAELSAYMACSLTRYLVESFEAKVSRKSFANLDGFQKEALVKVWLEIGKKYQITNPDRLPYSEALEEIAQQFTRKTDIVLSRKDICHGLQNLRKASNLPKPTWDE